MIPPASISDSVDRGWDEFFEWLPKFVGFLVIVLVGYIVAKIVGNLVSRALQRAGFDRMLERGAGGSYVMRAIASPSGLLGTLTFWAVFLGALSIAVDVLGIAALEDLVHSVWAYIPNILAALLIFVVAGAVASGLAALVDRTMGDTPTGGIVKVVAPVLVMAIATFMILDQLKIANNIVVITYAALMGAIALGLALAFGLGGRDVAGRLLEGAYAKGQEVKDDVRRDIQSGVESGKQQGREVRSDIEGDDDLPPTQVVPPAR
jgi:Mechanosensitive ion channel, conserved TM helix